MAVAALAAQRWVLPWLRVDAEGVGTARWVWAETDRFDLSPATFLLVREFDLTEVPARARLLTMGDEEYSLLLNGEWVGANRFHPGALLDHWDVTPLLRPGRNRVVVDLRSSHGPGGFVARLVDDHGKVLLRSDRTWRVLRYRVPGVESRAALPPGELPVDLGTSPVGRWGSPAAGSLRPAAGSRDFAEVRALRHRLLGGDAWVEPEEPARTGHPLGRAVTFDWGGPVEGYLALELAGGEGRPGLVVFGDAPPVRERPPADELVLRVPGSNYWVDPLPRRFRYATVVVGEELLDAKVYLAEGARTPSELRAEASRGVLGIVPPPLRAPVEDEIWRELEGLPSGARREAR